MIARIKYITTTTAILMTCLSSLVAGKSYYNETRRSLVKRSLSSKGCVLMIREDLPLKGVSLEEPFYECLLEDGTTTALLMDKDKKKEVESLIENGDAIPGESVFQSLDAMVTEDGIMVPKGETFRPAFQESGRRKLSSVPLEGNTYFLVVRVIDKNGLAHPHDTNTMSDKTFGTNGDPVNLKSQIYDCSAGKLNIVPGYNPDAVTSAQKSAIDRETIDKGHLPGMMEATIDIDITNHSPSQRSVVKNAAITKVNDLLGFSLPGPFDHVIFIVEKCYIDCGWAAYAAVNSWYMVYQGNYYLDTGTTVHEYGHNLGMAHSGGLDGGSYSDHTCQMGDPIYSDNNAKMCFNPAKSYYIGWYDEKGGIEIFDPAVEDKWHGTLMGAGQWKDYGGAYPMVVKIESGTKIDYYVGFNRAAGANADNDEADDLVTIIETGNNGETYSQSWLKGYIGVGQSYKFNNWQGGTQDIVITVESIDIQSDPGTATIEIELVGTRAPTVAPTPLPGCTQDTVMIDVTTDNYPEETAWVLQNSNGVEQAKSSPYTKVGVQDQYKGCHDACDGTFTISDSYGDGMCCSHGSGGYSINVNGQTVHTGEGTFGREDKISISCATPPPTTRMPTKNPTKVPTKEPTSEPTKTPTKEPTKTPTKEPTETPTKGPTKEPTETPTKVPTNVPTKEPTIAHSEVPTIAHSDLPTTSPSASPIVAESDVPTVTHSDLPTTSPSASPVVAQSDLPTIAHSDSPSASPVVAQSDVPTIAHSASPSASPVVAQSDVPTVAHSDLPTTSPSASPTTEEPTTASPTAAAPVPPTNPPTQWGEELFVEDFDGVTNMFTGGILNTNPAYVHSGTKSLRIKKVEEATTTSGIDIAGYSDVRVEFSYYAHGNMDKFYVEYSFDADEEALWLTTDESEFTDLTNGVWSVGSITFQTNGNSDVFIRLRGDGDEENDYVYFDSIIVSGIRAPPSFAPTVAPPTNSPTDPPVDAPTDPPVAPPIDAPTDPPIDAPTDLPVDDEPPTDLPVGDEPPTDPPIDAPVAPPVDNGFRIDLFEDFEEEDPNKGGPHVHLYKPSRLIKENPSEENGKSFMLYKKKIARQNGKTLVKHSKKGINVSHVMLTFDTYGNKHVLPTDALKVVFQFFPDTRVAPEDEFQTFTFPLDTLNPQEWKSWTTPIVTVPNKATVVKTQIHGDPLTGRAKIFLDNITVLVKDRES